MIALTEHKMSEPVGLLPLIWPGCFPGNGALIDLFLQDTLAQYVHEEALVRFKLCLVFCVYVNTFPPYN